MPIQNFFFTPSPFKKQLKPFNETRWLWKKFRGKVGTTFYHRPRFIYFCCFQSAFEGDKIETTTYTFLFFFFLKWCVSLRTENTLLFINVWLSLFSQLFFLITHCRLTRVFWTDLSFTVMSLGNIWCYCCTHLQTQFPALAVKETVAKSPASPHTRDIVSRAGYRSNGS